MITYKNLNFNSDNKKTGINLLNYGGGGRGRTDTELPPADFESAASAISPHRLVATLTIGNLLSSSAQI